MGKFSSTTVFILSFLPTVVFANIITQKTCTADDGTQVLMQTVYSTNDGYDRLLVVPKGQYDEAAAYTRCLTTLVDDGIYRYKCSGSDGAVDIQFVDYGATATLMTQGGLPNESRMTCTEK